MSRFWVKNHDSKKKNQKNALLDKLDLAQPNFSNISFSNAELGLVCDWLSLNLRIKNDTSFFTFKRTIWVNPAQNVSVLAHVKGWIGPGPEWIVTKNVMS